MSEDLERKAGYVFDWLKLGFNLKAVSQLSGFSQAEIVALVNGEAAPAPEEPRMPSTMTSPIEARNLDIVAQYEGGKWQYEIAEELGLAPAYVTQICKRYGASKETHRANRPYFSKASARNDALCAMYKDGKTLEQCGEAFLITRERARQILVRAGVVERHNGFFKPENVESRQRQTAHKQVAADRRAARKAERHAARAMYNDDYTYEAIAAALGHSLGWVQQAIWATGGPSKSPAARKPKKHFTEEQFQELGRRYAANEPADRIAQDFDIVPGYVATLANSRGYYRPGWEPGSEKYLNLRKRRELSRNFASHTLPIIDG